MDHALKPGNRLAPAILKTGILAVLAVPSTWAREVTDQTGRHVNVPDNPQRIVSIAPSITETVYAMGLGDRLVGDTDYCDYPPEARSKPHVGAIQNPSMEAIVALKPDLVLGTNEGNGRQTVDQLERLRIPLYGVTAHTLDGTLRSIEDLGHVLGWQQPTDKLVETLHVRVGAVEKRVNGVSRPKVLFVVWYRPLITAGKSTFISDVIREAGGVSISDDLAGEWPRMSLEEVLKRNPDVILFPRTDTFAPALEDFQKLPGWGKLPAVQNRRMYLVSETIMRPCPRLVDALEEVANLLHPEPKTP